MSDVDVREKQSRGPDPARLVLGIEVCSSER
jgi:hypothetical protein